MTFKKISKYPQIIETQIVMATKNKRPRRKKCPHVSKLLQLTEIDEATKKRITKAHKKTRKILKVLVEYIKEHNI